ncbi:hypothetical protein ACFV6D_01750 [Kitasatospora sp. NPDC059812]|uniref:hypothetical protein n=1 Tax=Kitasatospora sp. NPDC059812 TaxID=3346958 RepID=UPI0036539A3F
MKPVKSSPLDVLVATLVVGLVSGGLAQAITMLIPDAPPSTTGLVFLLVFAASLMAGVSASEPVMRRVAERRALRRDRP